MANNRVSKYTIELDIKNSDSTRRSIDDIEKSLSNITQSAKDGLSDGLESAKKEADSLSKRIKEIAKNGEDATAEIEAYGKAANKAISDLEKQAVKLTYSLSEQGKEQRARVAELQAELKTLGQTKAEKQKARAIEKEIKALQKDIVEGSDSELQNALKQNRSVRATLKLSQQEAKLTQAQAKQNKTLSSYLKDDLKVLKDKLKLQFDFIKALKTTEGRYKAIKTAASKIGAGTAKLAKAGAVGLGGIAAGAMAIGGIAVSSANSQVDREREADRIKTSMSKDEKQALLGDLYVRTGADYTTIVDAINRVTSVLGSSVSQDELAQATATEIRYPGASAIFRQHNTGSIGAKDYNIYQNRIKAIQSATGASVDDIQGATDRIANMRQSSFSNASMTELLALYAGLHRSGAYDTQEELDRAFDSFVRSQKNSKDSVFEHAKTFDWERRAYGATNKQQVQVALGNLDFGAIEQASKTTDTTVTQTESEKTAQKMRELEEKRNQIMMKLVEGLSPVLEKINVQELSAFFDSLMQIVKDLAPAIGDLTGLAVKILKDIQPYMSKLVQFLSEGLSKLIEAVNSIYEGIKNSKFAKFLFDDTTQQRANGGIASMPSIVGERGPEAIIPLDYSRSARAGNIINNISQSFSMAGNETTALSLAQVVKTRGFQRAMNSQTALNGRMGR